jgi:predicted aspartyl protease
MDGNRWALLCGLVGALVGCEPATPARVHAPPDAAAGEVEFRLAGPGGAALVVPVHVNGEGPFDFVLDTGATLTCVSEETAERLALPERPAAGIGVGIGGSGRLRLVEVDSLRLGGAAAEGLPACLLDLAHTEVIGVRIDGLLGLNFLSNFLVTLDFEREVVRLEPAGGHEQAY